MVSRSIVVIGVREGNPKNIRDWEDLAKPGITVLTPNVRTSGGARWNIAAIWGAAVRGKTSAANGSPEHASKLLAAILKNVKNMDPGARESLLNFERGVGDAIITYENEILVGKQKGQKYDFVVPRSTILSRTRSRSWTRRDKPKPQAATARRLFLVTPEAQRIFASTGCDHVDQVAKEYRDLPRARDLFTILDLGDWGAAKASCSRTRARTTRRWRLRVHDEEHRLRARAHRGERSRDTSPRCTCWSWSRCRCSCALVRPRDGLSRCASRWPRRRARRTLADVLDERARRTITLLGTATAYVLVRYAVPGSVGAALIDLPLAIPTLVADDARVLYARVAGRSTFTAFASRSCLRSEHRAGAAVRDRTLRDRAVSRC